MIISRLANEVCPTWETLFSSEDQVVMWALNHCPERVFDFLKREDKKEENEHSK